MASKKGPEKLSEKTAQYKGSAAEDIIESYLIEQYRPFAVNDIVQNLHNKMSKTNAVKALESLVKQQRITCKLFGKIAIYVCNEQELSMELAELGENVSLMSVMQLREELIQIEKDRGDITGQLQNMVKKPLNSDLPLLIETRRQDIAGIEQDLQDLTVNWKPENEHIIETIKEYERKIGKETTARKRILASAVSLVKEAMSIKNLDEFLDDLGFEKNLD
ncbi:LANO_0F05204g1_1 [Lachancea nothofagi CBS 11611]|uniref:LANO_0F05204g1_1 n=1 Tax=Lachancea nothofagi CBS 11611 TaxID=1266666 RepID=A0A1G4K7X2_9SACH|nr:LANO_0F05204g1_1 [Lachancea nothofagi CBS 11611]